MSVRESTISIPKKPVGPGKILGVDHVRQEKDKWCWAACAAMVLTYLKIPFRSQCRLAVIGIGQRHRVSAIECCHSSPTGVCNIAAKDSEITNLWKHFNVPAVFTPNSIPIGELFKEIDKFEAPVEIGYASNDGPSGIGHVVIAYGWQGGSNELSFLVHDPLHESISSRAASTMHKKLDTVGWDATWTGLYKPKTLRGVLWRLRNLFRMRR